MWATNTLLPLVLLSAGMASHQGRADRWEPLRKQLKAWKFTDNFAVSVGTKGGNLFAFSKGNFSMETKVETASTSKWPIAMMLLALVDDGTIGSLDVKASKFFPWWTRVRNTH